MADKNMHEAFLWEKERNGIRCGLCARRCFIGKGKRGFCLVRINKDNNLYTLNYGKIVAMNVDPIEKKPLFHFFPGSKTFSIASEGCNFRCDFCCNWHISQSLDESRFELHGSDYTPEKIVKMAEESGCKSISYTYTEPTMFLEFVHDTAKLAKRNNIYNVFVTNGYMAEDALKKVSKYLDAVVLDVKASLDPEFYKKFMSVPDVQPIYDTIVQLKKQRIFFEITNLIVPKIGDNITLCEKFAEFLISKVGSDIPFHVIQFQPNHKLMELPPTPVSTLEKCISEVRKTGMRYVYIGNVPNHDACNTYCHNCRELLIERQGSSLLSTHMVDDRCPNCGFSTKIAIE